jgi:hypothetical protein
MVLAKTGVAPELVFLAVDDNTGIWKRERSLAINEAADVIGMCMREPQDRSSQA